jgi:hypothetical protein
MHNLPEHLERLLPKFDPYISDPLEDHIKNFILTIWLMNPYHEDVVCKIFAYTFENKDFTWYFNLLVGSIAGWGDL